MVASVEIAKGVLNKTFTTHNQLDKDRRIELQLVDGPFKNLSGYWQFDSLKTDNACKVTLELDFDFGTGIATLCHKTAFDLP